jgi:hypothetical protein
MITMMVTWRVFRLPVRTRFALFEFFGFREKDGEPEPLSYFLFF